MSTTMNTTNTTTMTIDKILRMCIVTREKKPLNDLFRVCKTSSGIILIDNNGHNPGRGAYISKDKSVIEIAKKRKLLSKALKCEVKDEIYDQLIALI